MAPAATRAPSFALAAAIIARLVSFALGTHAYARHVGRYGAALSAAHADAASVLLRELARRLGVERVAGVDPSEPFVAAARTAVPDADVRIGTPSSCRSNPAHSTRFSRSSSSTS